MSIRCECGCGEPANESFAPGHASEALRMLLHLEGVLDRDEPIADFLQRRGYGRNGRNLNREYEARAAERQCRPADTAGIQSGQLTRIAHRVGDEVLKHPVTVGPEHHNRLRHVRAPDKPGVYVFSEDDRPIYVGRISNLHKRLGLHRSSHPRLSTLACKMARIKTGRPASKSNRSASSAMHLYDTDDDFRDAFNEAVDRIRAMDVTYITVPEDEDAGALHALIELHAAVELDTLELASGGYNSFRNT